eukprot:scaffold1933_cov165-Amphora_coffeaeformis.AAC.9
MRAVLIVSFCGLLVWRASTVCVSAFAAKISNVRRTSWNHFPTTTCRHGDHHDDGSFAISLSATSSSSSSSSSCSSASSSSTVNPGQVLLDAKVLNPSTGRVERALQGMGFPGGSSIGGILGNLFPDAQTKYLIVVLPQLGDFDTWEYCEQLAACLPEFRRNKIALRVVGIGDETSARRFARVANIPLDVLRVDPTGRLHRVLQVHGGPNWDVPSFVPPSALSWFKEYVGASPEADATLVARAWLNYMAMCAGIAAPRTLPEIIRGYVGDRNSPERLRPDDVVRVGKQGEDPTIVIRGTTEVKLGPIEYQSLWKKEQGYLRPVELATVRLRGMVECLTNFSEYVPDQTHVHLRGATFLFDGDGSLLYEYRDTGVLAYSETMPRPLSYLEPFIGPKALNPLGLGDPLQTTKLASWR